MPDVVVRIGRSTRSIAAVILIAGVALACREAARRSGATAEPGDARAADGVTVEPASVRVPAGSQFTFRASLTSTTDTSVTWQVIDANCGTITAAGVYTAPTTAANCRITATSVADPTKSATVLVTVVVGTEVAWEALKIGAGGWVTGIDVDRTGKTFVARTDTFGAYVGDGTGLWRQLIRGDTMPASLVSKMGDWINSGVYEIRVAPSDPNRIYMAYRGKLYRSNDRAVSFADTAFSYGGVMDANDGYRMWGEKMAVDPANPDVVYVGTVGSGLFVTTDGGASWANVSAVGVPGAQGITGIAFDESGGKTGTRTSVIYACRNGTGVYRSGDAGATWTLLSGGPSTVTHAAVATDGIYYAVNMGQSAYKFAGGQWTTTPATGTTMHSVSTDPFNPARIILGADGGALAISTDRGATWGAGLIGSKRVATDVPWLGWAIENYMSNGAMRFDPVVPNKLWFAEGIGVWYSTAPDTRPQTTWYSRSAGIDQLVGRDVLIPPGSANVYTAGMDRSVWALPASNTTWATRYGTQTTPSASIIHAWAVAAAANNSSHILAIVNSGPELSGYSLDAGATWTKFPTMPSAPGGSGTIAATSIDNIVAITGKGYAWRTTNRGTSWTQLTLPGASSADATNLHCGTLCRKHVLAVDDVSPNTMYLYFYGRGTYRSTDAGATWTLVSSVSLDGSASYWHAKLRAVPGQAGHLFMTSGQAGGQGDANPAGTRLWRSIDGGATWTAVANALEPYDVALGKAAPGATYPTIYFVGWYRNVYGIWRSTDNAATFTQIGPFPLGSLDEIVRIAASEDVYGDVYVAFTGSGWAYGKLRTP